MAGERTLTIKFVGNSKNAVRSVKDLVSSMDDSESAGKRVATAMGILSDEAETSFKSAKAAADTLSRALGEETVAQINAAGRSVDGYVADLKRMGLSYDDVSADVDELVAAIRKVETTKANIDSLDGPLRNTGDRVDTVRERSERAGDAMRSFTGNALSEMPLVTETFGPLGEAVSQITEGVLEGSVKLRDLLGAGLAIGGVTVVMKAVTSSMERQRAEAAANRKQVDLFAEALADGASAADAFREALGGSGDDAPKLELNIGDDVKDMVPILASAGITYEEFIEKVRTGNTSLGTEADAFSTWVAEMAGPGEDLNLLLRFGDQLSRNYADGLSYAEQQAFVFTETQTDAVAAMVGATTEFGSLEEALMGAASATESIYEKTERYKAAQDRAREAAAKRLETERELYGFFLSQIDAQRAYEVAVDSGEDAIRTFDEAMTASGATLESIDDAARTSTDSLISQAEAFAASKGAADGSKESIGLQIDELYRLATAMDPSSPLRSRLIDYIGELQSIPPTVDTMLRLSISAGATVTRDGDSIGIIARPGDVVAKAAGGSVRPTGIYAVGDNPDGSWNPTTELFIPDTAGTIMSASDSRAALGLGAGGGNTYIYLNGYLSESMLDELERAQHNRHRSRS